ncbi:MAG: hypothetical protein ACLQNE_01485 [Thermoguttaceae bacterium]|jgi:hypothetical protein
MSRLNFDSILNPWHRHLMVVSDVQQRFDRISSALSNAGVPYALVGGQAVAAWVGTKDPDAIRVTKDVDILLDRNDLPRAKAAALSVGMDYFEVVGVGMFLERDHPNPKRAVHLIWAGERVRPEYEIPAPAIDQRQALASELWVVPLADLVRMKLQANRDQDRVHLRDMIAVDLVGRELLAGLPANLSARLDALLTESGR